MNDVPMTNEPTVQFDGQTPYEVYVGTDMLHSLQNTVTQMPEERAFLVISQVMELYFGLLRYEWEYAQDALRRDDLPTAVEALNRSVFHFEGLNGAWASLRWLTTIEFNEFRPHLGAASGFQSWAYRHLEYLLGLKISEHLSLYKDNAKVYGPLMEKFTGPTLYDDVLRCLARAGYAVPVNVLERDTSLTYTPDPAVETIWVEIFNDPTHPLRPLADALSDVSEGFTDWRYLHLRSVKRTIGAKAGTGGSSGVAWLEKSLQREVFPELWSARTVVD